MGDETRERVTLDSMVNPRDLLYDNTCSNLQSFYHFSSFSCTVRYVGEEEKRWMA